MDYVLGEVHFIHENRKTLFSWNLFHFFEFCILISHHCGFILLPFPLKLSQKEFKSILKVKNSNSGTIVIVSTGVMMFTLHDTETRTVPEQPRVIPELT